MIVLSFSRSNTFAIVAISMLTKNTNRDLTIVGVFGISTDKYTYLISDIDQVWLFVQLIHQCIYIIIINEFK